ncbi:hypothetical protein KAR34_12800 [bacterium]|nr:hypothetical protein [bacterium]
MSNDDIIEIDLGYSPISDKCRRRLDEVTIKKDGQVWRIHKNDSDPFPSKPHAHNLESRLKMDLSTGNLYYKNEFQETIKTKYLFDLRDRAEKKGVLLPELKV